MLASRAPAAGNAVDLFVYRIGREPGSLAAAPCGIDAMVFTAGIGENASEIQARGCRGAVAIRLRAGPISCRPRGRLALNPG